MKIKHLLITLLGVLSFGNLFAHNLWIETNTTGKSGKEHIAKVYLGGYGENERDSVSKWFSNTKEVVVWLTEPGGSKKQLTTKAAGNSMEAVFTPEKDGVYTLSISHEVADIYGTSKIVYYALAQVKVGSSATGAENLTKATDLSAKIEGSAALKKPVNLNVSYKGKNVEETAVSICSPAGWVKGLETNEGKVSFDALWSGLYVAEVFYNEKTEGTFNGKDYKLVKHIVTYSFAVEK